MLLRIKKENGQAIGGADGDGQIMFIGDNGVGFRDCLRTPFDGGHDRLAVDLLDIADCLGDAHVMTQKSLLLITEPVSSAWKGKVRRPFGSERNDIRRKYFII